MTLLLHRGQPPAKPGDNHQDDQNSDKRDHHESKTKTAAGPKLFIVSQMITQAGRDARPVIDRTVRDALHAGLDGVPLALNVRVQGLLRSLPAFYVSNR